MMRKVYFCDLKGRYWPTLSELSPYFLTQKGNERWYSGGNDSWGLEIAGLYGTVDLPVYGRTGPAGIGSRVEAHLSMWGSPDYGALLYYHRYGGGYADHYYSAGDLSRLSVWVRTRHSDLNPVGLYIPFRDAWPAVKEFMETDGELPKCIPWITSNDLPDNTFPVPHDPNIIAIND